MKDIQAPFSTEQVDKINDWQNNPTKHPLTCGNPDYAKKCQIRIDDGEGILLATIDCLTCPCGEYSQKWVHDYIANSK